MEHLPLNLQTQNQIHQFSPPLKLLPLLLLRHPNLDVLFGYINSTHMDNVNIKML